MEPNNLTGTPVDSSQPVARSAENIKSQTNQAQETAPTTAQQASRPVAQQMTASKESLWYVDNYVLLKDYYDRTISRIAARCVRMGNIAMEEYPFYGYILDVLEEISDTGDYILQHKEVYPYVEKKIAGGLPALKKTLAEYKEELRTNASPEMIKEDASEVEKMKEALGAISPAADDPTAGAGMSMDQLMEKLLNQDQAQKDLKKVVKIKKPISTDNNQVVPPKSESTEE